VDSPSGVARHVRSQRFGKAFYLGMGLRPHCPGVSDLFGSLFAASPLRSEREAR